MKAIISSLIAVFFFATISAGDVLRVPSVFSSIQEAFSILEHGDTILVAPGVYVEALTAPASDFVMLGEVAIDSFAVEFSVIDPTDLPGSDSLRCLTLTGGRAEFRDIVFRNRSGMTSGRASSNPGGVRGDTTVVEATFERCMFDSVHSGVSRIDRIMVNRCRFIGSRVGAVYTGLWRGRLFADSTWFDGATLGLVTAGRGGLIKNCLFTHRGGHQMLVGLGDSLLIENCHFLGLDTLSVRAILIRPRCGSHVRDCLFENILYGSTGIVDIVDTCFGQPKGWDCELEFINNRFLRCGSTRWNTNSGGEMVHIRCSESGQGFIALLDSNMIDSTQDVRGMASGIVLRGSAIVRNTIFGDGVTRTKPQVAVYDRSVHDTAYFRHNSFGQEPGGIEFFIGGTAVIDARDNWWGHASGPFHPQNNPSGQGAYVDDGIRFNPWLLSDPDTANIDTNEVAVDDRTRLTASEFVMTAFPNPFNAVTTLQIEVGRIGDYEVILYDVTGRVAAEVFTGRIDRRQSVSLNADGLSSGVYFARLSGNEGTLAVSKVLLLK